MDSAFLSLLSYCSSLLFFVLNVVASDVYSLPKSSLSTDHSSNVGSTVSAWETFASLFIALYISSENLCF